MKVLVIYYSLYGHIKRMADAVVQGVNSVNGAEAVLKRVPETLSDDIIAKMGATDAQKAMADIPVVTAEELSRAQAIVFGVPTRYGNPCGQISQFLDSTGGLWAQGSLVGKVGSVFSSSATQHGGNEATLLSMHRFLLHQGMVVVGLPYAFQGQMTVSEVSGGSPYGATTISGGDGSRLPSENELEAARYQGKHVAEITAKLFS